MTKFWQPPNKRDKEIETQIEAYAEHVKKVLAKRYRRALELAKETDEDET